VPTSTDDRRDVLTVIAHMRAKPGREQELRDALTALVEPTSKEAGSVDDDLLDGGLHITRLRRIA
jgi:hypothetical protein